MQQEQQTREKYFNSARGEDKRRVDERTRLSRRFVVSADKIWEVHHEIKRLIFLGWKNVEIADKLGITMQTVGNVRNSPVIIDELRKMEGARDFEVIDVAKRMREFAPVCLNLLENIVSGEEEQASINLRARTAESFLDRVGFGAPKKVYSESYSTHFTMEEIERLKQRAFSNQDAITIQPMEEM